MHTCPQLLVYNIAKLIVLTSSICTLGDDWNVGAVDNLVIRHHHHR